MRATTTVDPSVPPAVLRSPPPVIATRYDTADALQSPRVRAARTLVEALIAPLGDRWLHTRAVARRAVSLACGLPAADQDLVVTAAWLHDVGYAPTVRSTGMHAIDGARFLRALGLEERVCALVAFHSGAAYEADERGLGAELRAFAEEHSPAADALVAADFTTGPQGQPMSVDARIAEILVRYRPTDPVHRAVTRSQASLRRQVDRAVERAGRAT
jgi:putative nucleotidyltransferase with HDIG domain